MPFRLRLTIIFFAVAILSAAVLPLLYPIPPLETVPPQSLAGANDQFAEVEGVNLRYTDTSTETSTAPSTLLLLHGFGSSVFSWRKVTQTLGEQARVVAFDRPGFGLSQRPAVTAAQNPYTPETQVALSLGLLDELGVDKAVLVGNSAGGAVAVNFALAHPERVAGLVLVDAAFQNGGPSGLVRALFGTPQATRLGPYLLRPFGDEAGLELLRRAYADPSRLTDADVAGYRRPLQADNWDRALWEVAKANRAYDLLPRLAELSVPTLVVSGAEDEIVPLEQSQQAAADIPGAELKVLKACGHVPQEECPQKFLGAVTPWLNALQNSAD